MLFITFIVLKYKYDIRTFEKNQRDALIGEYVFNIDKTSKSQKIKGYDLHNYRNLKIFINQDGTFLFSEDTPFIYDSTGVWSPRKPGLDHWNWIAFSKNYYIDKQPLEDCQFADSWKMKPAKDSVLIFNSMTPKPGKESVHVLYFDKIKR